MVDPNNLDWLERRDPSRRPRELGHPDAGQDAPSGRAILIMFGVIVGIVVLIALLSWSSAETEAATTPADPATAEALATPPAPPADLSVQRRANGAQARPAAQT